METVRKPSTNEELAEMLDALAEPETKIQKQLREEAETLGPSRGALAAMNRKMQNIYGGTVDPVTVSERRAKNKRARKSRRTNRLRSKR